MPHLGNCQNILRGLIAKGDIDQLPLARRAIDEYLVATPAKAQKSGLRLLQDEVLIQRNAAVGDQRNFAEIVNIHIEQKIAE